MPGKTAEKDPIRCEKLIDAYIQNRIAGLVPKDAALAAGYKHAEQYRTLEKQPRVRFALQQAYEKSLEKAQITRDDVIAGILDGIGLARLQGMAGDMIRGWVEIARMQGLYAPERHIYETGAGQQLLDRLSQMSDHELMQGLGRKDSLLLHQAPEHVNKN